MNDAEVPIQVQALNLLRNLACAKPQDIDFVFQGVGPATLMNLIEEKLSRQANNEQILTHVN